MAYGDKINLKSVKMKFNILICFVVSSLTIWGCQKADSAQLEKDAKTMAILQCEARQLKDERFKIANDIRYMEDSLMKNKIPLSISQSHYIDSIKNIYTVRTGLLATKITKTMDSLFATNYKTLEQRQVFDTATEKILHNICK
ncbi:MAG: hypothetical protein R2822_04900 [Spirosomataceae bacterium]